MKYCVFGSNKNIKTLKSVNNLTINSYDFEKALNDYKNICNSKVFKHVYFLVDFGEIKDNPLIRGISMNQFNLTMIPWLLLNVYDTNEDKYYNPFISKIYLKMKGFTEEYEDPILGFKRFIFYLNKEYQSELYCDFLNKSYIYITSCNRMYTKRKHNFFKYCKKYKIK